MRATPASVRLPYSARVATIPSRRRSVSERVESGRAARQQTPRGALAEHLVVPTRPDPVELLHESDSRRDAELLPLKYERMSASKPSVSSCWSAVRKTKDRLPVS